MSRPESILSLPELERAIGFTLPLESTSIPLVRHSSSVVSRRDLISNCLQRFEKHETRKQPAASATNTPRRTKSAIPLRNTSSATSSSSLTLSASHDEWNASVKEDRREYSRQVLVFAVPSAPLPPLPSTDDMCQWRLINWCAALRSPNAPLPSATIIPATAMLHPFSSLPTIPLPPMPFPMPFDMLIPPMPMPMTMPMSMPFMPSPLTNANLTPATNPPPFATASSSSLQTPLKPLAPFTPSSHQTANVLLNLDTNATTAPPSTVAPSYASSSAKPPAHKRVASSVFDESTTVASKKQKQPPTTAATAPIR